MLPRGHGHALPWWPAPSTLPSSAPPPPPAARQPRHSRDRWQRSLSVAADVPAPVQCWPWCQTGLKDSSAKCRARCQTCTRAAALHLGCRKLCPRPRTLEQQPMPCNTSRTAFELARSSDHSPLRKAGLHRDCLPSCDRDTRRRVGSVGGVNCDTCESSTPCVPQVQPGMPPPGSISNKSSTSQDRRAIHPGRQRANCSQQHHVSSQTSHPGMPSTLYGLSPVLCTCNSLKHVGWPQAARSAFRAQQQTRSYSLLDKLSKQAKDAVNK